jgi:hypothetical protein
MVLNYTTGIQADKTIGEIQKILAEAGAARIAVDYEDGRPSGVTFGLTTVHGPRLFTLPVDVSAMQRLIQREWNAGKLRSKGKSVMLSREQAERVAWRIVKDWLAAQMALVAADQASIDQVMLPYVHVDHNKTLYAAYQEREQFLALEAPRG